MIFENKKEFVNATKQACLPKPTQLTNYFTMSYKSLIFFIFLMVFENIYLGAQGCSDAGFCTAGTLRPQETKDTVYKHAFKLSVNVGIGEQSTTILQAIPEFSFSFFKNNNIQVKIPYTYVHGNLGQTSGLGDPMLSISQTLLKKNNIIFSVSVACKLASNQSNIKKDTLPLPMPYQVSLGTNDLIVGFSFGYKKWNIGAGYQRVISDQNKNSFLRNSWGLHDDANQYFESNQLKRGDDALLRIERGFRYRSLNFSAGIVGIYRLEMDKILIENPEKNVVQLDGSDGFTLNLTGGIQYLVSNKSSLYLSFGMPLVVRNVRPDGLTRALVINMAYQLGFGKH